MNEIEKSIQVLKNPINYITSDVCEDNIYIDKRLIDACNVAISALEAQQSDRWIPVSERFPNEKECNLYDVMHPCHRKFICTIKIGEYEPQIRELYFSKVFGWKYGPEDYNKYVIAWKPLPESYKEEAYA